MTTPSGKAAHKHVVRYCTVCSKPFELKNKRDIKRKKYCSSKCRKIGCVAHLWNQGPRKANPFGKRQCKLCKKFYMPKGAKQKHCLVCCPYGKHKNIMYRYSIPHNVYQKMIRDQKGCCKICERKTTKFMVDHDHACCSTRKTCGKCVRGLLCFRCNILLGFAEDHSLKENVRRYLDAVRPQATEAVPSSCQEPQAREAEEPGLPDGQEGGCI